ncbi:5846_t:CDS:2, partial [Gigaspora rosea]
MGRTRRKSVSTRRSAQHVLPSIELSEERTNTSSTQSISNILSTSSTLSDSESNIRIAKSAMIENPVDILDYDTLPDWMTNFQFICIIVYAVLFLVLISTIRSMHDVQLQMTMMIHDIKRKIDEMHENWKVSSKNFKENEAKWIELAIGDAVYSKIGQVKYPTDEQLMEVCYDALLNTYKDEFQNKKPSIMNSHIVKPKTENKQVSQEEEQKFKDADITQECYLKLNQPVDANDNPNYTYINLIIDRTFTDPDTEKNSIAFGMAVALNYLDPTKGINMVPSE